MRKLPIRRAAFSLCVVLAAVAANAQQTAVKPLAQPQPNVTSTAVTTTGGTNGLVPVFTGASTIGNSIIYANSKSVGIGVAPSIYGVLDVGGTSIFRGALELARTGNASASTGTNSNPFRFNFQVYNGSSKFVLNPFFQFQSEATGNNTANPAGTMNLLYYNGVGGIAAETGLYFNSNGVIHFAPAQTFPIAQGPQGPAGPQGPQGNTGPVGPTGPQGPALSFPYSAAPAVFGNYAFLITNRGKGGAAYFAGGTGYDGLASYGGASDTSQHSAGGRGIVAVGGGASAAGDFGGPGGYYVGGSSPAGGFGAGDGIEAYGGNANDSGYGGSGIYAVVGTNGTYAAVFNGNVFASGNISKAGGSFRIDHPDDPANKYLSHSFVESPDMMNIYNGNVVTDGSGTAVVTMPTYFESLNRDFRYQLTIMGHEFAQALVAQEIANGSFTIRTDKPNIKVSWQVTGVRQDAWANAHRIPVEEEKPVADKGKYLHPELFGRPDDANIEESHRPNLPRQKRVVPVEVGVQ